MKHFTDLRTYLGGAQENAAITRRLIVWLPSASPVRRRQEEAGGRGSKVVYDGRQRSAPVKTYAASVNTKALKGMSDAHLHLRYDRDNPV